MTAKWDVLDPADAARAVHAHYGLSGEYTRLASERDDTFKLDGPDGRFVVKVANPAEEPASLVFQSNVLLFLESLGHGVPVPRQMRTRDGAPMACLVHHGRPRHLRVLTWLDGEALYRFSPNPAQAGRIGSTLGQLDALLAGFSGETPAAPLQWDVTHVLDLADLAPNVDDRWRHLVTRTLEEFADRITPVLSDLAWQVIHNDFNPHNVLVEPDQDRFVTGVIDFGDMVHAPRINDLAVAASYQLATPHWRDVASAMIGQYNAIVRMTDLERQVLPLLIKARLALSLMITESRAKTNPENRIYILRNHAATLEGLGRLSDLPAAELGDFVSWACEARTMSMVNAFDPR